MKTLALLFALFLYLLPNPTHSTFNPIRLPTADVAVTSQTPVLDTDGDEVWAGRSYYITSTFRGAPAGGVRLPPLSSSICPSRVIVTQPFTDGDRIRIWRADFKVTAIFLSTFLSFAFVDPTPSHCVNRLFWWIQWGHPSGQYFLEAGLYTQNNGARFMIEAVPDQFLPDRNIYKIIFCPLGTNKCYDVGRYFDKRTGATRLALTEDIPFTFMFKKAS